MTVGNTSWTRDAKAEVWLQRRKQMKNKTEKHTEKQTDFSVISRNDLRQRAAFLKKLQKKNRKNFQDHKIKINRKKKIKQMRRLL